MTKGWKRITGNMFPGVGSVLMSPIGNGLVEEDCVWLDKGSPWMQQVDDKIPVFLFDAVEEDHYPPEENPEQFETRLKIVANINGKKCQILMNGTPVGTVYDEDGNEWDLQDKPFFCIFL